MPKESPEIKLTGIKLSKRSATPLYMQLYEQVRGMIIAERLRPLDRLPASRSLAKELSVSRIIISQAYELLLMEGYVEARTGSGTFIAKQIPDKLLNAGKARESKKSTPTTKKQNPYGQRIETIPFQMGSPSLDMFPYKTWQKVGTEVLKELKKQHLGYDDAAGHWPLRVAIASYLRQSRAVNCEADRVMIVTGSQQGLNLVTGCLLKTGDKVWMEDPGYFGAKLAFNNAGIELCPIPIEEDGMNVKHGVKKFGSAKLAYVTPSHQFPLGNTLSSEKRTQLLQWAAKEKAWIFEDDYDSEFRYEGRPLPSLQGMDQSGRVIYSGTFSKVLFPGLRIAYIVLPTADMVDEFRKLKETIDRQAPAIEQLILTRFIEQGHFLRHIRKMRLLYAQRQQMLIDLLNQETGIKWRMTILPSGMHIICWLPKDLDIELFKKHIDEEGIIVSFISEYTLKHKIPPGISLGFTAFSKFKLKTGVQKLITAFKAAMP